MMLETPLPGLPDTEGAAAPFAMPMIVDAHVHLFPKKLFQAVWRWFDNFGWPIRYRLDSPEILTFLLSRGVGHVVAFQYAHKAGIASGLNQYMVEICRRFPGKVTGLATVFPGEKGAAEILKQAFKDGLAGVKLHAHVQCFQMNSPKMNEIYDICDSYKKPVVMHVGREPKSPAYACDPHAICHAEMLEEVITRYPELRICVPHLGMDEFSRYRQLIETYDTLWLDTAMALTDYLPGCPPFPLEEMRADRIMYGSDFPNIPYAWDRELKKLHSLCLKGETLERIAGKNAVDFFSIRTTPLKRRDPGRCALKSGLKKSHAISGN